MRPAATQETPCNLCGARHYIVVGTSDRDGEPLQTVLCRTCGLVWTNPRPEEAAIDAYYATLYRADYKGHAAPPLRKIVRGFAGAVERRALLREVLKKSGESSRTTDRRLRMIDVGSGAGELVFLMRRDGVDYIRCLACDQVFEVGDLDQTPVYDDEAEYVNEHRHRKAS